MPSFILFLSKFGTFIYNVVNWLIIPTTHSAFPLLLWFVDLPSIRLVWMACSWEVHINLSVSQFRVPFRNYCYLSWLPVSLFSRTRWPCKLLSSQEIVHSSFFCFLAFIVDSRIDSIKSISTGLGKEKGNTLWTLLQSFLILNLSILLFPWHLEIL